MKYHVAALIFFAKNNYNFYQRTGMKRKTRFHESFYTFCVYYVKFGNRGQLRRSRLAIENLGLLCLSVTEAELNQRENNEKRGEKQAGRYRAARESSNRASLSVSRLCIFRSRRETRKSGWNEASCLLQCWFYPIAQRSHSEPFIQISLYIFKKK